MIVALLAAAMPQAAPDFGHLAFMAGHWRTPIESRVGPLYTEEYWSAPAGGMMLGYGRTLRGIDSASFEYMRISVDGEGGVAFYGQPGGAPAVTFRLARASPSEAVFENPAHDFPQRITYRREGDTLTATISRMDGGNAQSWRFERLRRAD